MENDNRLNFLCVPGTFSEHIIHLNLTTQGQAFSPTDDSRAGSVSRTWKMLMQRSFGWMDYWAYFIGDKIGAQSD
jgi:hypothetical protein